MIKLSSSDLKVVSKDLSDKVCFNHISNITLINSHDLFMTFSNYRKEKLLVSLNPSNPFLSLCKIENPIGTKIGQMNDTLRKEIKDGCILAIDTLNNDRVLEIKFAKTNDYFEKVNKRIIIELIPHRPNLIILDEEDRIIFATHYTEISNAHPVLRKLMYKPIENNGEKVEESEIDLSTLRIQAEKYYQTAIRKRLEEQFKPVLTHIKSRIKTLKKKMVILENEINAARDSLVNQDIGQMILTYSSDEESLNAYISESGIEYDHSLTPGVNASKYFSRYKKAKRTIEMDQQELEKTETEIDYLETCLKQSEFMNEDDIIELANLLFPNKFKLNSKKKIEAKPGEIKIDGARILYGKNAKQNENLTFKKANKEDLFFHVKDTHGSHVILISDNPTNEQILTACEITLLLSKQEIGDVQSTKVKNVKKGSFIGQALFTSYQTYTINSIREKTRDLLKF